MSSPGCLALARNHMEAACISVALLCPLDAFSQTLHERSVGSKVTRSFDFGTKRIHVPDADWILVGNETFQGTQGGLPGGPRFAGIFLVEIHDGRLARGITVFGNITPSLTGWDSRTDPCKRPETARVHRNLSQNIDNQFCFDVNEVHGAGRPQDWQIPARDWLLKHGVAIAPTRLIVRYAMLDRGYRCEVRYSFDPDGFPGDTLDQKVLQALRWAEENLATVRSGLLRQ